MGSGAALKRVNKCGWNGHRVLWNCEIHRSKVVCISQGSHDMKEIRGSWKICRNRLVAPWLPPGFISGFAGRVCVCDALVRFGS